MSSHTITTTSAPTAAPAVPSTGRLRPLGIDAVRITGGFWGRRQSVNAAATLPHIGERLESEGWLPNFDLAASGALPHGRRGREFSDSEIYKYLEALAWEIGRTGDASHEERFRAVVARVSAAQEPDGYLNTHFGREGQGARWSDLEWGHELYCLGHLFQAAVARERTRPGADDLLAIARSAADLVCAVFGEDGIQSVCGHPEIEVGLAELSRVTGEPRYARQARLFVDRRGTGSLADIEWGRSYYQDDVPVREAEVLRGHAVRANYLAAGAVDVAVDTGDGPLLDALRTQWANTVARRTYITGGQGSHHQDEAFGEDWELPSDRAYSETCASIGSIMFAWRLMLADGGAQYADLIERTLYNVVATSPAADGRSFYYANTLHQRVPGIPADPDGTSLRASSSLRAPWFEVSCCPTNVARTFASLTAYVATTDDQGLQLHQYAAAEIDTTLPDGQRVALTVETNYPDDGVVRVIAGRSSRAPWSLTLRVPSWAEGAVLRAPGEDDRVVAPGTVTVRRAFEEGDVVELDLPMQPRFTHPDPRIDAVRGCVVVERGPEVFALESVDSAAAALGEDVSDLRIDASVPPHETGGRVYVRAVRSNTGSHAWPYGGVDVGTPSAPQEVPLVAYHDWAGRGPSTMRVWIPAS
ncbi:MAG TPA: beta-L-arabinofuranosidase domain-containing protein [Microbacterium sp.]|nr:beta-L-arabinofuranosidase domain-containing protein [Microbacterium sp.]